MIIVKRLILGFLLSLVFLAVFSYLIAGLGIFFEDSLPSQNPKEFLGSMSESVKPESTPSVVLQPVANLELQAEAGLSLQSNLTDTNKIIFEKNTNMQLPIASLTKLMTAMIVLDNYNLSQKIMVDPAADAQLPMKQDVNLGDSLTVESFLDLMMIESSNKSAYALSELIGNGKFVGLMNDKAKQIGLYNTVFVDPTGLSSQDVSTAGDLAKLTEYIIKNYPKIADISKAKELLIPGFGKAENTDQLLGEIPEIVCGKTGFTTEAKGCLILATKNQKDNSYFINVILGADDRFAEMKKLVNLNVSCQ